MYNKTIIRFASCDIQNNHDLGNGYQPQLSASVDNAYLNLDYSGCLKNIIQELFVIVLIGVLYRDSTTGKNRISTREKLL